MFLEELIRIKKEQVTLLNQEIELLEQEQLQESQEEISVDDIERSKKLRQVMKDKSVNVPWLHERTKIPKSTLYDWFYGKHSPKLATLKAVAEQLGVSTDELID